MAKIKVLPSDIISKIAAGEVIERPASVVKELVENALDAKATSIELYLKEAGKTSLQIKDNGHGIEQEDLNNIFLRHATSKIQNEDDLAAILSLGFRGEALYSIGSIADVTLKSKTKNAANGWQLHIRGGNKLDLKPCALGNQGTEIEVKELFFNTPARRKFLKTNQSEIYQILNTFIPYTLLNYSCRFKLTHQDKDLLDLAPAQSTADRLVDALQVEKNHLIEIEQNFPEKKFTIHMILGDINIKRPRRDLQFIFVNGRPVQNKNISYTLNQVYRLILPPELFPFFCVFIQMPAEDIDVNIHPTKREIKIKQENNLCSLLRSLCEQALMKHGAIKQIRQSYETLRNTAITEKAMHHTNASPLSLEGELPAELFERSRLESSNASVNDQSFAIPLTPSAQGFFLPSEGIQPSQKETLHTLLKKAQYVGGFINKFLLFEAEDSLLIIDQHAAQERIVYEQLITQMQKGILEVQYLLSPTLLKMTPTELLAWEEGRDKLAEIGFETNQWDKQTIAIHSHPQLIQDTEKAVHELLTGEPLLKIDNDILARRACRSSIMAGDRLNQEQAEHQKNQLLNCLDPFTCPHGRPTIIELTESFLDKQFLRTK